MFSNGVYYKGIGFIDEALHEYRTALSLNPDYPRAHYNLALAYDSLGRVNEAMREYREALRIKNEFPEAHNNLGAFYL